MKAKLYGPLNNYVGSATLPDDRPLPPLLKLDEGPRGGVRLFAHGDYDRYDEVDERAVPVVRLDPTPASGGGP